MPSNGLVRMGAGGNIISEILERCFRTRVPNRRSDAYRLRIVADAVPGGPRVGLAQVYGAPGTASATILSL